MRGKHARVQTRTDMLDRSNKSGIRGQTGRHEGREEFLKGSDSFRGHPIEYSVQRCLDINQVDSCSAKRPQKCDGTWYHPVREEDTLDLIINFLF